MEWSGDANAAAGRAGPAADADATRAHRAAIHSRQTQQSEHQQRQQQQEQRRLLHLTVQMSKGAQFLRGSAKVARFHCCQHHPTTLQAVKALVAHVHL